MGCDYKVFILLLFSKKEFCELYVDVVRHAEGGPLCLKNIRGLNKA